jgi:hypothetical protein
MYWFGRRPTIEWLIYACLIPTVLTVIKTNDYMSARLGKNSSVMLFCNDLYITIIDTFTFVYTITNDLSSLMPT